jgi:hypothetical protein
MIALPLVEDVENELLAVVIEPFELVLTLSRGVEHWHHVSGWGEWWRVRIGCS